MNPYDPPNAYVGTSNPVTRGPFLLAGIASMLASAYWAVLTLILMFGAYAGTVAGYRIIVPVLLVGVYAMRGFQIMKGNPAAAKRVIFLHVIGAGVALLQVFEYSGPMTILFAFKVAVNVAGAITAHLAVRAFERTIGEAVRV